MKGSVKRLLAKKGFELRRINTVNQKMEGDSMLSALDRLHKSNFDVIVDVGAAQGTWAEKANQFWPNADYLLIEPLRERNSFLEKVKIENITILNCVLGSEDTEIDFNVSDDLDGSGVYGEAIGGEIRKIPQSSLDTIIANQGLENKKDVLLKLDTHGFEIPIFEGALKTFPNISVIIVEVYGFFVSPHSKLCWEIAEYLNDKGYRLFDIVDILRREKDNAFWQADFVFMKSEDPIFKDNSYA